MNLWGINYYNGSVTFPAMRLMNRFCFAALSACPDSLTAIFMLCYVLFIWHGHHKLHWTNQMHCLSVYSTSASFQHLSTGGFSSKKVKHSKIQSGTKHYKKVLIINDNIKPLNNTFVLRNKSKHRHSSCQSRIKHVSRVDLTSAIIWVLCWTHYHPILVLAP